MTKLHKKRGISNGYKNYYQANFSKWIPGIKDEQRQLSASIGSLLLLDYTFPLLAWADLDPVGIKLVLEDGDGQTGQGVALTELIRHSILLPLQYLGDD